jgi:hypothetical protein
MDFPGFFGFGDSCSKFMCGTPPYYAADEARQFLRARNTILRLSYGCPVLAQPLDRDTWTMDSYQGAATLEWWANGSTCLGEFDVQVHVCVTDGNWACDAELDPERLSDDHCEVLDLLMGLDPVFTLRFDEGSEILVNVLRAGDSRRLTLTAYEPTEQAA